MIISSEDESTLKSKLLKMFGWFHNFCVDNGLIYYALGGTMLGAARHEGFIPWDDDVDIGMPRSDYEKLAKLMAEKTFDGKYVLETPSTSAKEFNYPFSKIYDTETTLIENNRYKIKRGIFLDIFPLDGIGNSFEDGLKNYKRAKKLYNRLLLRVAGIRKGRKLYKNLGVVMFRLLPGTPKKALAKLVQECKQHDYDQCSYVANLLGAWGEREISPKNVFGKPTLYKFEGIQIYGVEKYDEYLTTVYGNWRQPPPAEKQVSHHDFAHISLNQSYLNI